MKLTPLALNQINNSQIRMRIAQALKCTEHWIYMSIKANKSDGVLTKGSAIKVIKEETGLKEEEILTAEVLT